MTRHFWVLLHRYAGLAMAVFLVVVGLTGSLLAFLPELNRITAPHLFPPVRAGALLDAASLAESAGRLLPKGRIDGIYWGNPGTVGVGVTPRIDPASGKPYTIDFNQLFLDPHTGEELGRRQVGGGLPAGWDNFMPFIYRLHCNLSLGRLGKWVLGITALVWTIDCFVSFYLTLPALRRKRETKVFFTRSDHVLQSRGFWRRWKPAWRVKRQSSAYRVNFDLHRAGGLWLWAALLVFAWSSVFMNLHDQVYAPVTRLVLDYPQRPSEGPKLDKPLEQPLLGWRQAHRIAERLMAEQAGLHGFIIKRPVNLWINREQGTYHYVVHSSLDFQDKRGRTAIIFDANTGGLKQLILPSGQHSGATVTNWLQTLHEANVFGLPYRIFVCILGLAIAMLSGTGVYIWWKKYRARSLSRQRRSALAV